MAMSYVIRKTSSPTMVPLALRAISISSARVVLPESQHTRFYVKNKTSFHSHQFSTAAVYQKLVKVLKSEIKSMEGRSLFECTKSQMPATPPSDFPYKIEVKIKGDYSSVKLKRELPGEEIEVCVWGRSVIGKEVDNDNNSSTDSSEEEKEQKYNAKPSLVGVRLVVKIFKKDGTFMEIEVHGCADVIIVKRIDIHVPCDPVLQHDGRCFEVHSAPEFKELARDVQYSIKEFIGVRGINTTNVEFLKKYSNDFQIFKSEMRFLKAFKNFVDVRALLD